MELEKAIKKLNEYSKDSFYIWAIRSISECEELREAIDTVLKELDNRKEKRIKFCQTKCKVAKERNYYRKDLYNLKERIEKILNKE